jgi:arsenate reductase (thioredoxin)
MKTVIFACIHNAGRSQIAAAWRLTDELARGAGMLITMGCGEQCPVVPGLQRDDWPLEDPKGKSVERVREIRDEVKARIQRLIDERGWQQKRESVDGYSRYGDRFPNLVSAQLHVPSCT